MSIEADTVYVAVCDICKEVTNPQSSEEPSYAAQDAADLAREYDWAISRDLSVVVCPRQDEQHKQRRGEVMAGYRLEEES